VPFAAQVKVAYWGGENAQHFEQENSTVVCKMTLSSGFQLICTAGQMMLVLGDVLFVHGSVCKESLGRVAISF
jgi:hypothetical protein